MAKLRKDGMPKLSGGYKGKNRPLKKRVAVKCMVPEDDLQMMKTLDIFTSSGRGKRDGNMHIFLENAFLSNALQLARQLSDKDAVIYFGARLNAFEAKEKADSEAD
jgi:hypothetical protein